MALTVGLAAAEVGAVRLVAHAAEREVTLRHAGGSERRAPRPPHAPAASGAFGDLFVCRRRYISLLVCVDAHVYIVSKCVWTRAVVCVNAHNSARQARVTTTKMARSHL